MKHLLTTVFIAFQIMSMAWAQTPKRTFERIIGEPNKEEFATNIFEGPNNFLYVCGSKEMDNGRGLEVFLMKMHRSGRIEWTKTYGTPVVSGFQHDDRIFRMIYSTQGNEPRIYMVGHVNHINNGQVTNKQGLVICTDLDGDAVWLSRFKTGSRNRIKAVIEKQTELLLFGIDQMDPSNLSQPRRYHSFTVNKTTGAVVNNGSNWGRSGTNDVGLGNVVENFANGLVALGNHNGYAEVMDIDATTLEPYASPSTPSFTLDNENNSYYTNARVDQNGSIIGIGRKGTGGNNDDLMLVGLTSSLGVSWGHRFEHNSLGLEGVDVVDNGTSYVAIGNVNSSSVEDIFMGEFTPLGATYSIKRVAPNAKLFPSTNCFILSSDGRYIMAGAKINSNGESDIFVKAMLGFSGNCYSISESVMSYSINSTLGLAAAGSSPTSITPISASEEEKFKYDCKLQCTNMYKDHVKYIKCPGVDLNLDTDSLFDDSPYHPDSLKVKWWRYNKDSSKWVLEDSVKILTITDDSKYKIEDYQLLIEHVDGCIFTMDIRVDFPNPKLPEIFINDTICPDTPIVIIPDSVLAYLETNWNNDHIEGYTIDYGAATSSLSSSSYNRDHFSYIYSECGDFTVNLTIHTVCSTYHFESNVFKIRLKPVLTVTHTLDCPTVDINAYVSNCNPGEHSLSNIYYDWSRTNNGITDGIQGGMSLDQLNNYSLHCKTEEICVKATNLDGCEAEWCGIFQCIPEYTIDVDGNCTDGFILTIKDEDGNAIDPANYTILWSTGDTDVNPLDIGNLGSDDVTIMAQITDADGCTINTANITINGCPCDPEKAESVRPDIECRQDPVTGEWRTILRFDIYGQAPDPNNPGNFIPLGNRQVDGSNMHATEIHYSFWVCPEENNPFDNATLVTGSLTPDFRGTFFNGDGRSELDITDWVNNQESEDCICMCIAWTVKSCGGVYVMPFTNPGGGFIANQPASWPMNGTHTVPRLAVCPCPIDQNNLPTINCGSGVLNRLDFENPLLANSIQKVDALGDVKLYPNPTSNGIFYLELENGAEQINIIGLDGKIHLALENVKSGTTKMDVAYLKNGMYLLEVKMLNTTQSRYFMKQ